MFTCEPPKEGGKDSEVKDRVGRSRRNDNERISRTMQGKGPHETLAPIRGIAVFVIGRRKGGPDRHGAGKGRC